MSRKEYTYSYAGQIMEIEKEKNWVKRKSNVKKNTISSIHGKKNDEENEKPNVISVEFGKK